MEAIICKDCDGVITYLDGEKAGTLYGHCATCQKGNCSHTS
ncbi:GapA-binding peptide SR1P [Marininema halotolerans]|uniref:SR1 protein n=1 Tax=Marininema halotolerans TaxID=1155944 RepID=A0A1I6UTE9_9BACL|nr:GapA-binding peptide SR1P [Marininema halotolerans]SFT04711.1 SR1 protein [Marininema halotolerans]